MGCLSNRKKQTEDFVEQKWDYINLADFKAKGCGPVFAYGYLWFSLILSIAVYGVDTFTAVQLLVFNRWSSAIEPAIPLNVSRWIFSVCIILSFINLAYEGVRATRIIKRGNVADCYLDSLAVRWESIRVGSGQGWKRFLVFTEITKNKKGAHYIALFTYFSFQSWIRTLFCMAPRQVVNALTLRSVYLAKLAVSSNSFEGSISGFFDKIKTLAQQDLRQAAILVGMCFTLVIWVFSALYLITAVLFYVFFLFHWIPRADGGLSGYCERKVNQALLKIVTKTVNKALAKGQAKRMKEAMDNEKGMVHPDATLPTLPNVDYLSRQNSGIEPPLPAYSSRPETPVSDWKRPPMASRTGTVSSNASYSSRAPLVSAAADMGYGESATPDYEHNPMPPLSRQTTMNSQGRGPQPNMSNLRNEPYFAQHRTQSPAMMGSDSASPFSTQSFDRQIPPRQFSVDTQNGRSSPAPSANAFRPYHPPVRSATGLTSARGPQFPPPQRTMTAPMPAAGGSHHYERLGAQSTHPPRQDFHGRSGSPQGHLGSSYTVEAYSNGRF